MCQAGQSKAQQGLWSRKGITHQWEGQGSSLCLGNGSSVDISEKMSACSGTEGSWTFIKRQVMVETAGKMGIFLWKTHLFSAKTSILKDSWIFVCQFGIQNCDELCVRYHFPARLFPGCASLSFVLCHLLFSSLKRFNCLISSQSQQHVT